MSIDDDRILFGLQGNDNAPLAGAGDCIGLIVCYDLTLKVTDILFNFI